MTTKEGTNMPLRETQEADVSLGDGVYDTLKKHGEKLEKHDDRLDGHDLIFANHENEIKQLKENSLRLENVVMSESRETRLTITNTNTGLQQLITELMGYKTNENQLANTLKMAKYESYAKIIALIFGSGSVGIYLIQKAFE